MNPEQAGQDLPQRIPQRINEGMIVYDRDGEVVGTVQVVYFGGASEKAVKRELHSKETHDVEASDSDSSTFAANDVPEELVARLMKQGYVLVSGPDLTGAKRFLTPEQIEGVFSEEIEGVVSDAVRLRVTRDELINS